MTGLKKPLSLILSAALTLLSADLAPRFVLAGTNSEASKNLARIDSKQVKTVQLGLPIPHK